MPGCRYWQLAAVIYSEISQKRGAVGSSMVNAKISFLDFGWSKVCMIIK